MLQIDSSQRFACHLRKNTTSATSRSATVFSINNLTATYYNRKFGGRHIRQKKVDNKSILYT